ncbi:MAG: WD40 repeat domain-containing protein [Gemmataceae bacterium]
MKLEKTTDLRLPTGVLGLAVGEARRADASTLATALYAACMDGVIYAVDPASGTLTPFEGKHASFASGCVLTPDGRTLISAGYDGWLLWHDVTTKRCFRRVHAHTFWSWQMALSRDGRRVATVSGQYLAGGERYEPAASPEPTVKVYDAVTGDLVRAFDHGPPVLSVAFGPDGRHVAAANMMGEVRVWDVETGALAATIATPDFTSWGIIKSPHYCGGIYGLAFSPDGGALLVCGMGPMTDPMAGNGKMTWQRWDWRTSPPTKLGQIRDGDGGTGLMETLAFAPDGGAFLMAGRQAQGTWTTALFAAGDGKLVAKLDTKSRVTRAAFTQTAKPSFSPRLSARGRKNGQWSEYGRIHVVKVDGT